MSEAISGDAGRIGFLIKGEYSSNNTYSFLDVVYHKGSTYVAKKETTGNEPEDNNEFWQILASGVDGDFASKAIYGDTEINMGRVPGSAIGTNSIAYGKLVKATGTRSISLGANNESSGEQSMSVGYDNFSIGKDSFTFGEHLYSISNYTFSEGCGNIAASYGSHVEGAQNISGAKYILKIASYDTSTKEFVFDNTYTGFSDSFSVLETGSKLFIPNTHFVNDALTFTVASIGSDGKSVIVNENIPTLNFNVSFAIIINVDGDYIACHSEGRQNISSGIYAHSEGFETEARGFCSHTEGYETKAIANQSHSEGFKTQATGNQSHAGGLGTIANEWAQTVCGKWNAIKGDNNYFSNPFIVGNGNDANDCSNAFRVRYSGEVYAKGNYNSSGADYAEFIKEWNDGNPYNEDRVGYFVTVKDGYLYKANEGDYIVGITSGNPSIVGNSDEEYYWRWERDEFNRIIYEEVPQLTEKIDEDGLIIRDESGNPVMVETGRTMTVAKQREDYDSSKQSTYTERKDRKEWDYVGMVGVVPVRDDGTCKVGKFCKCADDGIATLAEERGFDTYMVIERVSENIVSVILK